LHFFLQIGLQVSGHPLNVSSSGPKKQQTLGTFATYLHERLGLSNCRYSGLSEHPMQRGLQTSGQKTSERASFPKRTVGVRLPGTPITVTIRIAYGEERWIFGTEWVGVHRWTRRSDGWHHAFICVIVQQYLYMYCFFISHAFICVIVQQYLYLYCFFISHQSSLFLTNNIYVKFVAFLNSAS
jgi:hypothetical protein